MSSIRVLLVGGLLSYRALFSWLSPWVFIPTLLILPVFQILLFAYVGRNAGIESDEFFVIGNAVQYSAAPCLVAMGSTIAGERGQRTLGIILSTPTPRVPLFLGRAIPVIGNAWLVSMFSLVVGGLLLHISVPLSAWLPIALVVAVACASCTGLGMVNAALGLRVRETSVLSNVIFGLLLILCGANVPLASLPGWMAAVAECLPLTHAIAAARMLADGATLGAVAGLVGAELLVGVVYLLIGLATLRSFEISSRRRATLDVA
jgi:ABC-2 type transport system permease protein